jgi:hypothetical protein
MAGRRIRSGQLISPFGVGAVIDQGGESFVCMDVSRWPRNDCEQIRDNPLAEILRAEVRSPPTGDRDAAIPVERFPRWMFCPTCRHLYRYTSDMERAAAGAAPSCPAQACKGTLLNPMRFIAACKHGHLQDVDWHSWAHRNAQTAATGQCSRQTAELYFQTTGASGGDFNAMSIECRSCGAVNTLEGLTQRPYIFGCAGKQPWQPRIEATVCNELPRVFPRNATNVYYSQTRSAIDVSGSVGSGQAGALAAFQVWISGRPLIGALQSLMRNSSGSVPEALYRSDAEEAVRLFGIRLDEALAGFAAAIESPSQPPTSVEGRPVDDSQQGILLNEWPVLSRPTPIDGRGLKTTVIKLSQRWPSEYADFIDQATLVHRLREVRALLGFRRVQPDSAGTLVPSDLGTGAGWFPGVETFGEGIFLRLNEARIAKWEKEVIPAFTPRMIELTAACERWGRTPAALHSSPRFIALHTFAHAFIRRLAFDAGYSAASIRERIYCSNGTQPAAGIMVYTADGDSEGSLGGLVRQGEPNRLIGTIKRTLADLAWCSADPVCRELEAQGVDGLNSAACHACSLISETSCAYNNSLLDRRLLIGNTRMPGLFRSLLQDVV